MRRALAIIFSARASQEIDEARAWWAQRGAQRVLDEGIAAALRYMEAFPEAPPLVRIRGRWSTTRRASVEPAGYRLWYVYDRTTRTVLVRCFRHKSRHPPRL